MWLIYGAEFLGVIIFRFRKDTKDIKRPYKVPLVIAFFCLGVSLFMTLTPIISDPAIGYLGQVYDVILQGNVGYDITLR